MNLSIWQRWSEKMLIKASPSPEATRLLMSSHLFTSFSLKVTFCKIDCGCFRANINISEQSDWLKTGLELGCIPYFLESLPVSYIADSDHGTQPALQEPVIEVTSCEREMLLKGVTLYSCQSKYLPLRTRKTGVEGWLSRILSGLSIGLLVLKLGENKYTACWRSPLQQIERGGGRSRTLIGPSVSSPPALIGPLILWARLSLLLQSFLPSLLVTPYSRRKGCVASFLFFSDTHYSLRPVHVVSAQNNVCRVKRYPEERHNHPELLWASFLETQPRILQVQHYSSSHSTAAFKTQLRHQAAHMRKIQTKCP